MGTLNKAGYIATLLGVLLALLIPGGWVTAGERIDKTNAHKAKGMVPDQILEMIEKGDVALNTVREVNFSTDRDAGFWLPHAKAAFKGNLGKYELDENDLVVAAGTGRVATDIVGIPFPEIDVRDPKAGTRILYNKSYIVYQLGAKHNSTVFKWIGRGGYEREIESVYHEGPPIGWPGSEKIENPNGVERYGIISVRKPYDVAGTSVMLWRFLDVRRDMNFSYVPAVRRVRRMSPASRSDAFLGSDLCVDDILGYDGKIGDFEWKLLEETDAWMPWHNTDPLRVRRKENGELQVVDPSIAPVRYGYQEDGWDGAPWCPVNTVFLKGKAYVVEAKPKDPYYNYGTQYLWIDKTTNIPFFKIVHDRGGRFWKAIMVIGVTYESADGDIRFFGTSDHVVIDVIRDHATLAVLLNPGREMTFFKQLDMNDFSIGGFVKYCK